MIRYRCPACGAAMMSAVMEAGTEEHCPQCGRACIVPPPPPASSIHHRKRHVFATALIAAAVGLVAGFVLSLAVPRAPAGGASRMSAGPGPIAASGPADSGDRGDTLGVQARRWEEQKAALVRDAAEAKQWARDAEGDLADLLDDANVVYLPSARPADANVVGQLGGIQRVAVLFAGSAGAEAAIGVRDVKSAVEAALTEAGFTIDASQPDAHVLLHVTVIPFALDSTADADVLLCCVVQCGVSRRTYLPGADSTAEAVVWMTTTYGAQAPAELPKALDTPKDAVGKAIVELAQALRKAKT